MSTAEELFLKKFVTLDETNNYPWETVMLVCNMQAKRVTFGFASADVDFILADKYCHPFILSFKYQNEIDRAVLFSKSRL